MRDIKQVLRGFIPSGEVREWDVTPVITVVPGTFTNEDIHNAAWNGTTLHVNGVGNVDSIFMSAMKTTLTMADLSSGQALRYSVRLSDILVNGALFFGLIILPSTTTAAAASQLVVASLQSQPDVPVIVSGVLHTSTETESLIGGGISNDLIGVLNLAAAASNANIAEIDVDVGYVEHLFLRKYNNEFYICKEIVSADGTTYDIYGRSAITNNPVVPDDMTVYLFAGSLILNGLAAEHARYSVQPTFEIVPISRDVANTTFEAQVGDQEVFDDYFPTITTPSSTVVAQRTFPLGARPLEFYKTKVMGLVGVPIEPYGITISADQLLIINNVDLGSESFTPLVYAASISDMLAPVFTQQTAMLQSIAEIGTLVQQSATDVNKALINAGEMVVFVKNLLGNQDLNSNITFDTFDAAYLHLSTFPQFIKKRIVLDDRLGSLVVGTTGTDYHCAANNITLSTYTAYTSENIYKNPSVDVTGTLSTYMLGNYFDVILDRFEGRMAAGAGRIADAGTPKHLFLQMSQSFFITDKTNLDLPEITSLNNAVLKNHSCFIYEGDFSDADAATHPNLYVTADETSSFDFAAYNVTYPFNVVDKVIISRLTSYRADTVPVVYHSNGYVRRVFAAPYTESSKALNELLWMLNLAHTDNAVVRHPMDFGDYNYNNGLQYTEARRFIIAGNIDLSTTTLNTYHPKLELIGLPGASLTTGSTLIRLVNGETVLEISNLTLKANGAQPMIEATDTNSNGAPSLLLRDCILDAANPISWVANEASYTANTFELTRVKLLNVTTMIAITAVSRINIQDIVVDCVNNPSYPLFSVTFKPYPLQPKNILVIDGVDVYANYSDIGGNQPAILNIAGVYTPSENPILPYIFIENIRNYAKNTNQMYPEINVYRNMLPYDIYDDTNFETGQTENYAFAKNGITFNIGTVSELTVGSLGSTDSQVRGFQIGPNGLNYVGLHQRRFKVHVQGHIVADTPLFALSLRRVLTSDIPLGNSEPQHVMDTLLFNSGAGINADFEFLRVVTLRSGYTLALYGVNNNDTNDATLSNVVWSVTEL